MSRIFFCSLCYSIFFMSELCFPKDLTLDELIHGVNLTRNRIRSGEVRAIVTVDYAAEKSPAEIKAWMQEEREQTLKDFANDSKAELERQLRTLPFHAERYSGYQETEESNFAFQIFDQDVAFSPEVYQYKMTRVNLTESDLYSERAHYFWAGALEILTYDGQTEALERAEALAPRSSFELFDSRKNVGFLHFELYGSPARRVPVNARLIGKEAIAGADCYILEFQGSEGNDDTGIFNFVRIWVDAEKNFCIRKEEFRQDRQSVVSWENTYEHFQKLGDIWFPMAIRKTHNKPDGTPMETTTVLVKEAAFNVDFPENFFQVDPQFYFNHPRLRISPLSEIISPEFGHIEESEPPRNSTPLESDILLLTCGPNSLLRICELLKINTNFDELAQLSRFHPNRGTTMLGLWDAARYKGLNPKGIQANIELLKKGKVPMPAVAYIGGNHFLVFEAVTSEGVLISDPADKYEHYLSFKELSETWKGELLIFDYQPEQAEPKPVPLVLAEAGVYDFGEVLGGGEIRHTFKLKNIGQKPLKIEKVEESCACTATIVSKDEIPPGEFGIIEAVLKVPSENRQVEESINVYTNNPIQSQVTLTLKGTAFVPITTFPSRLFIGSIPPKTPITKSLTIHRKGDTQILGVRTDSDYLKAAIMSTKTDPITRVEVTSLGSAPSGTFFYNLLINYRYKGKAATHEVMVFGEVLGAFAVFPKRLFFGLVRDKQDASKTITISSVNNQLFKITSLESDSAYVTTKVTPQKDGVGYQLTATVQPEAPVGELSGEILVRTDSTVQPVISVLFSGIIPSKK